MRERQEPKHVTFAAGDVVEGKLVSIERIAIKGQPGIRYTVQKEDGEYVSFFGTWQLNTKLRKDDVLHYVRIVCEGEDTGVKRGDNNMKVFTVQVSEKIAAAYSTDRANPDITDDDIPF